MTDEERDLIQRFVAQVGGHPAAPSGFLQGSVPTTTASPDLPPVDPQADQFIAEQFTRYPEARYRITQMAFVQQAALSEAQNRLRRMEWELNQARQGQTQSQAQPEQHGLFSRLLGGGAARPQAADPGAGRAYGQQSAPPPGYQPGPPPPQYPPNYQPGMFQAGAGASGSGFLGSALRTATGVAGGVLAADAISSMFHGGGMGGGMGGGGFGGGFGGGGETVNETVNNYGDAAAPGGAADPWGGSGQDYQPDPGAGADPGQSDPFGGGGGGFDQGGGDAGGFDGGGGGWDDQGN